VSSKPSPFWDWAVRRSAITGCTGSGGSTRQSLPAFAYTANSCSHPSRFVPERHQVSARTASDPSHIMAGPSPHPELDGESRVGEIVAILSVASILSTLAVVLRCYSRAVILRSFGLDDAIMVPAQVRSCLRPAQFETQPVLTPTCVDLDTRVSSSNRTWYVYPS
jgi:hypothetical protein